MCIMHFQTPCCSEKALAISSLMTFIGTDGNSLWANFILYRQMIHRKEPYIHSLQLTDFPSSLLVLVFFSSLSSLLKHSKGNHQRLNHLQGSTDKHEPRPPEASCRAGDNVLSYKALIGKMGQPENICRRSKGAV